jgi:peptide/nickel transport system permease protein
MKEYEETIAHDRTGLDIGSRLSEFWRRYRRNRPAVIGLVVVVLFAAIAIFAQMIAPYDPFKIAIAPIFDGPSAQFLMGSDSLGRDVFSGVVYGARISLMIGFFAASTAAIIGILVGSTAGYLGGIVDIFLMRTTEVFQTIPAFFMALVLATLFGSSVWNVIILLGILSWPRIARLVRAEFLSIKEREFVEAARAVGSTDMEIVFSEILPNSLAPVIVDTSMEVGRAILTEAGLSFLGLGDLNQISWGMMLNNAQPYLRYAWWMAVFPGVCIFILVLALNLVGDGLNDALNPRLKEK